MFPEYFNEIGCQFPYRKNPASDAVQHCIRLGSHPWRSVTRHKARPRTFRPRDKWSRNKVKLLQICWSNVVVHIGSASQAPNLQEASGAAYLGTIQNNTKINKGKMYVTDSISMTAKTDTYIISSSSIIISGLHLVPLVDTFKSRLSKHLNSV